MLAFGPEFFTMHQNKDFVAKNVSLAPTFQGKKSIQREPNIRTVSESKELPASIQNSLSRERMINQNISQTSLDSKEVTQPSNLSIKQQIQLLDRQRINQQSCTINAQSNISVNNGNHPEASPNRYKTEKEKFMDHCHRGLKTGKDI